MAFFTISTQMFMHALRKSIFYITDIHNKTLSELSSKIHRNDNFQTHTSCYIANISS